MSWQSHPWELETPWPCGTTASHVKRLGKIQQTSDLTYKQTRVVMIDVFHRPAIYFSLHTLALTNFYFESINVLRRKMLRSIVG